MLPIASSLNPKQHPNHRFFLEHELDLNDIANACFNLDLQQRPSELLGSLDLQKLPGLMSSDPSLKDRMSDLIEDDDEEMDVYDIFTTPGHSQARSQFVVQQQQQQQEQHNHRQLLLFQQQQQYMRYQQQQHHQQLQQSLYQSAQGESKPLTPLQVLRPYHPMVLQRTVSMPVYPTLNSMPTQTSTPQSQSHDFARYPSAQRQQESQHLEQPSVLLDPNAGSDTSLPHPSRSPLYNVPGAERFVPLPEQFSDLASLDRYVASLQRQHPTFENTICTLDQDVDLMMFSSLTLLSPLDPAEATLLQQSFNSNTNTSGASSNQSPSLSWASPSLSRETSPSLSPIIFRRQASNSMVVSSVISPLVSDLATTSNPAPTSPTGSASASSVASSRRRRRIRLPAIKKPKTLRPTSYACTSPGCDKIFSRAYNLTSHMKTHSLERPFLCGICPFAFARRHDRERHLRLHTGEKPYACEICGVGFMRNDAQNRHQKLCGVAGSSFAKFDEAA
ncbi:hypothetical protein BGX28_006046 [Mortierella sp. GBA30]|nr:hypothetical protein BGX28_006046 [Mortierella sp. GBA30]